MLPKVIITYPYRREWLESFLTPHAQVVRVKSRRELLKKLPQADAMIALLKDRIDVELLEHAPRLKAIGCFSVGVDHIDFKALKKHEVRLVNTPDVLTRATAELTLTLLLAAARRVPEAEALCRSGGFSKGWTPDSLLGKTLQGRNAVIVGQGRIGSETARLFRALGIRVSFITRKSSAAEIRKKLRSAQILSLHFPLTPQTRHWLDARKIALLPSDAIVLNTTRGPTIDEKALIQALKQKKIWAAGLDVYEHEPHIPKTLRKLSNVVLLPHVGSATEDARREMARLSMSGVIEILSGKHPGNEVQF